MCQLHSMKDSTQQRIYFLDSLRGIAAIMVVFYHFIGWHYSTNIKFHLSSLLFNGSDAVSFFFVLSGLVLSIGLFKTVDKLNIWNYTYRRVLRLYPAYVLIVLLNFLYWNRGAIDLTLVKELFFNNSQNIWQELLLLRANHKFYVPGWTLEVEMALSLLMPLVIIIAKHNVKYLYFLLLMPFLISGHISSFIFHFTLGTLIAYHYDTIKSYDFKSSKWFKFRYFIYLIIFIFYSIRHIERMSAFGPFYYKLMEYFRIDLFHYTGLASAAILIIVINSQRIQNILHNKIFKFLGDISYSVYLTHWLFVVYIMDNWTLLLSYFPSFYIGFISLLVICITATIISSYLVYKFIELPFIKLSKKQYK